MAPDYYSLLDNDKEFYREATDKEGKPAAFFAYKQAGDPP
jgi:hypothetical protein